MASVVYPIRIMATLGVTHLISKLEAVARIWIDFLHITLVTNAAGGLNPNLPVGTSKTI